MHRWSLIFSPDADIEPTTPWETAKVHGSGKDSHAPKTRDIIKFLNKNYGTHISSGSYDDIRRKNLQESVGKRKSGLPRIRHT